MKLKIIFVLYLSVIISSATQCPYDWLDFGDYGCFKFVDDSNLYPMSWTQGQEYCQSLYPNSDLAQVSSLITQSILSTLAHTSRNGQKSYFSFKCRDLRHIPKVRVFDADFRKVKIKLVDLPVSEIPTHKVLGSKWRIVEYSELRRDKKDFIW